MEEQQIRAAARPPGPAEGFEQAMGVRDMTSTAMARAIREWYRLYFGDPYPGTDPSQRLACAIVAKLERVIFGEYRAQLSQSAQPFYTHTLAGLESIRRQAVQQLLVGGEVLLKPVPGVEGLDWVVLPRCNYIPLGRDCQGKILDLGTVEQREEGGYIYRLLERRTLTGQGMMKVENRLFRSRERGSYGVQVALDTLDCYRGLEPQYTCPAPLKGLGMVQLKSPLLNCVDFSCEGVSVYAPAVDLIRAVDRNEAQMNNEFENGASRILVSADLLTVRRDSAGRAVKRLQDTVFTALDEAPEEVPITVFSPQLRHESYLARKRDALRSIESLIGLARGTLSDVEQTQRTATEIADSRAEYALTAQDYQEVWQKALEEGLKLAGWLGKAYGYTGQEYREGELAVDWGNGLLYDQEKDWQQLIQMAGSGVLKPELLLAWKYGLPHQTPQQLAEIRQRFMPEQKEEKK